VRYRLEIKEEARQQLRALAKEKRHNQKLTLKSLAAEMRRLQERIEDMEDLIELRSAVERNAGKPGVRWEKVKAELELE
jgi:hypothetical protein